MPSLAQRIYVDVSPIHGKGVFARRDLAAGEFIGTYTGKPASVADTYVLWVCEEDGVWYGRDGRGRLRYLNHAAAPNAEFWGWDLYAARPIAAGEEITFDYGEPL